MSLAPTRLLSLSCVQPQLRETTRDTLLCLTNQVVRISPSSSTAATAASLSVSLSLSLFALTIFSLILSSSCTSSQTNSIYCWRWYVALACPFRFFFPFDMSRCLRPASDYVAVFFLSPSFGRPKERSRPIDNTTHFNWLSLSLSLGLLISTKSKTIRIQNLLNDLYNEGQAIR